MSFVFDTSALICLIKEEKGYEKALTLLQDEVFMNAVNLAEFCAWINLHSNLSDLEMLNMIQELEIKVVDLNLKTAVSSGNLISETKKYGLSLGDRICLATGQALKLPIVTCDTVWSKLNYDSEIIILR